MSGSSEFLDTLSNRQSAQPDSAKSQSGHRMPPPAAKSGLPLPGRKAGSLQKQAVLQAATAHSGPLGTIPDDAPLGAASSVSSSSALQPTDITPFTLTSWEAYLDKSQDLQLPDRQGTFRVYTAGLAGPVIFCLHGGGYTSLTWAMLTKQLKGRCRVTAFDQRGHGETVTQASDDLCAETLTADAVAVWKTLYAEEKPPLVLVGHSMGGAIAVRTAATKEIANLQGLVVIDVVEGTAMSSLPHMMNVLRQRPPSFPSLQAAVHWARKSGMSKNTEAACISMPSCLVKQHQESTSGLDTSSPADPQEEHWVWRTPLAASQPFWEGWYKGLSDLYMSVIIPKVLVLAGTDRLDKPLTVGQMQGKFQLVLLPQAGHAVHEDQSAKTAEVIASFIQRFRVGLPKMQIPRAGDGATRVLPVAAGPAFTH